MKNKWIWAGIILVVIIGVGGKLYMNKAAKEKQQEELHDRQVDLANYIYNNYHLYTFDTYELGDLTTQYGRGEGEMTYDEYSRKLDEIAEYSDIIKIEFTKFTVSPMNTLNAFLIINDVYTEEVSLSTISAETNKFLYKITNSTGNGPYYIEEKKMKSDTSMPITDIIFYDGAINK